MTLIDILTAIVLVLISALVIFLIIYIGKITRSIQELQKDISKLAEKLEPLVTSLSEVMTKLSDLSELANRQLEATKGIIFNVKERIEKVLEFEEKIRTGIEGSVMGVVNQFKAISNGVSTFLSYLKK